MTVRKIKPYKEEWIDGVKLRERWDGISLKDLFQYILNGYLPAYNADHELLERRDNKPKDFYTGDSTLSDEDWIEQKEKYYRNFV